MLQWETLSVTACARKLIAQAQESEVPTTVVRPCPDYLVLAASTKAKAAQPCVISMVKVALLPNIYIIVEYVCASPQIAIAS